MCVCVFVCACLFVCVCLFVCLCVWRSALHIQGTDRAAESYSGPEKTVKSFLGDTTPKVQTRHDWFIFSRSTPMQAHPTAVKLHCLCQPSAAIGPWATELHIDGHRPPGAAQCSTSRHCGDSVSHCRARQRVSCWTGAIARSCSCQLPAVDAKPFFDRGVAVCFY